MTKILNITASPRGETSGTVAMAQAYLDERQQQNPDIEVDNLNVWDANLIEFDGDKAAAKMTFFGVGAMNGQIETAWDQIVETTQRFISADEYVFSVPMWNGGIPYKLKQYIDIITQPGLLFGFDPEAGYSGLLTDKKATVFYAAAVYTPGAPAKYGLDFHSTYLDWWLDMIGVKHVENVRLQPSLITADPAAELDAAIKHARTAAA
ncbi:MAG TPA: FMN-dependent NADH-azoreductase [Gammaproteobacteria bacterium]|nr:FMN-dependent NADH-azoreductase [Gammaproteobacteria bacterium]